MEHGTKRRLAAILSADVAGYSRMMGADEVGTHHALAERRRTIDAVIAAHGGRVVNTAGDGFLAEFSSAVDAVSCAVEAQRELARANADLPVDRQMRFRIGINLGDVIVDGADLFGDGVNVAARLQALAEPGGIYISGSVHEQVHNKLGFAYRALGRQKVKNIAEPVQIFAVAGEMSARSPSRGTRSLLRRSYVVGVAAFSAAAVVFGTLVLWQSSFEQARTGPPILSTPMVSVPASNPAIAVLPFANLSGNPEDDYFSDGLTEDLIAALGRFSGLTVIGRNAAASYKGVNQAREEIGRALGVAYVVEGSVRKGGERVRITAQLADAASGAHLWSERFDTEVKDVFAVQDEITRRIASALAIRVSRTEQERALAKPAENLAAYDLLQRGRERLWRGTRAANREARQMFEHAIEMDPRYAPAYASLGMAYNEQAKSGWTEFPAEAMANADRAATRALELDPSTAEAYHIRSLVYLFRQQYDLALAEVDRALEINPSDAKSHAVRGSILMWSGRSAEAVPVLQMAQRLDPNVPIGATNLGMAYYFLTQYEEAVQVLEFGISREPSPLLRAYSYVALAAAYAQLGRMEDAARAAATVTKILPFFTVSEFVAQFKASGDREHIGDGLRRAGLQ